MALAVLASFLLGTLVGCSITAASWRRNLRDHATFGGSLYLGPEEPSFVRIIPEGDWVRLSRPITHAPAGTRVRSFANDGGL